MRGFTDLITSVEPIPNLYTRIKERIIENFASSPESELRSVLKGESLNDRKPSAFLNKMRHLSRGRCSDEVLKSIFLENLPPSCRSILAVSDTADLTRLATIADRIVENNTVSNHSVALVSENSSNQLSSDILNKMTSLVSRLDALSFRNRNKPNNHSGNRSRDRNRSKSRSRSRSNNGRRSQSGNRNNNNNFCFYHDRFRIQSRC